MCPASAGPIYSWVPGVFVKAHCASMYFACPVSTMGVVDTGLLAKYMLAQWAFAKTPRTHVFLFSRCDQLSFEMDV